MEAIVPTSQPSICYHQLTLDRQGGETENGKGGWKSQALTVYLCWQEGVGWGGYRAAAVGKEKGPRGHLTLDKCCAPMWSCTHCSDFFSLSFSFLLNLPPAKGENCTL